MRGYTLVVGRGKLHAYSFSAATEQLPYTAVWSNALRASETRGNTPVIELQASRFGGLIYIFSQYVKGRGRDFGYTQYLHPVPEGAGDAKSMADIAAPMLFYDGYYDTDGFWALDSDPDRERLTLKPLTFDLPALPAARALSCGDELLGSLLADLWRLCDERHHGRAISNPLRISVCPEEDAAKTLQTGLLFLAKAVIPRLPRSVTAILSVTLGAEWASAGRYTNTACCVVQHRMSESSVGYNVHENTYFTHLDIYGKILGEMLASGQEMRYYSHMENLLGVCPLCADYFVASSMAMLERILSANRALTPDANNSAANKNACRDLNDCTTLWQTLAQDIKTRFRNAVDAKLCRLILLPIEQDILLLQSQLSHANPPPRENYEELIHSAFRMQSELDSAAAAQVDLSKLREAYAAAIAKPGAFSDSDGVPFLWFLERSGEGRFREDINGDIQLLCQSLKLYVETHWSENGNKDKCLRCIEIMLAARTESDARKIHETLLAYIRFAYPKQSLSQREVNELCKRLHLDGTGLQGVVLQKFTERLKEPFFDLAELANYFDFADSAIPPNEAFKASLTLALNESFSAKTGSASDWLRYLERCCACGHYDERSLLTAWSFPMSQRLETPMSDDESKKLHAFCKQCPNRDRSKISDQMIRYFNQISFTEESKNQICGQISSFAEDFKEILMQNSQSEAWRYFLKENILNELLKALETFELVITETASEALSRFCRDWRELSGLTYLDGSSWPDLPNRVDKDLLTNAVTAFYSKLISNKHSSLAELERQLEFLKERPQDWFAQTLTNPILQHVFDRLEAVWREAFVSEERSPNAPLTGPLNPDKARQALNLLRNASSLARRGTNSPRFEESEMMRNLVVWDKVHQFILVRQGERCADKLVADGIGYLREISLLDCQRLTALLQADMNSEPVSNPMLAYQGCILGLLPSQEQLLIDWSRMLQHFDAELETVRLDKLHPASPEGRRWFRTLLYLLNFTDPLPLKSPATLTAYLEQAYPRWTRAVRHAVGKKSYLRTLCSISGALDNEKTKNWATKIARIWAIGKA